MTTWPQTAADVLLKKFFFYVCFAFAGEKLSDAELDEVVKDCMDPEDEDGMIPYVREYSIFYYYIIERHE